MRLPSREHGAVTVRLIAIVAALTLLCSANLSGISSQSPAHEDPVIGEWRLDLSKSKYSPGPAPKSETRTYRSTEEGIRAVIVRTHHDGQVETIEYGADYDSINNVIGTPDYDAVKLTRVSPSISEATLSHAGRAFGSARREIAKDGMTMVITFKQESQTLVYNVAYYVKVKP